MNTGMNTRTINTDEWETPPWLFMALDREFAFTFDAAAQAENALCDGWTNNVGMGLPRGERFFCNPPYSNIAPFVHEALAGRDPWVLVLPNRTDTRWFHRLHYSPRVELRPFTKRISFWLGGKPAGSPRFGTILAIVKETP